MKQLLIATLLTISAAAASAGIDLPPGGSVMVDGHVITCAPGVDFNLEPCSIREAASSAYYLMVGEKRASTFGTFKEALDAAAKMKQAGLCR